MGLKVIYLDGPEHGKALTFDDTKDEISFGRKMTTDVHFPDDLTVVGREHFGLIRNYGGYKFAINPTNPVFINNKPVFDDEALDEGVEVRLGSLTGPRLKLEQFEGAPSNQAVTDIRTAAPELTDIVGEHGTSIGRGTRIVGGLALLVIVLAGAGYVITHGLRSDVTTAQGNISSAQQGISTAQHDISAVQQQVTAIQTDVPAVRAEIAKLADTNVDAAAIIAKSKESVYLVRQLDAKGEEVSVATASVVQLPDGRKALATNSHVTEMFDELKTDPKVRGGKVVVVQSKGPDFRTLKVVSAIHHPGYELFGQWVEAYSRRMIIGAVDAVKFEEPGWDVGLLFVDDPSKLGPALTIASRETLLALRAGDPLVSIGFPAESLVGTDHRSPDPTSQTGRVVSMTSFFLRQGKPEENQLVQESIPVAGGASGSPVFNTKGEIVALVNAGNMAGMVDGQRIPNGALVNYAQRADMLLDLMSGKVDDTIPTIKAMMADEDKELAMTPEQQVNRIDRILAETAGGPDKVEKVTELDGTMSTAIPELGSPKNFVQQVTLNSAGLFVFVLQSGDGRPLHGVTQSNGVRRDSPSNAGITFVAAKQQAAGQATLIVADMNAVEAQNTTPPVGGSAPPPPAPADGTVKVIVYKLPLPPQNGDAAGN